MNRQITQLFALVVGLFALLVTFTSRWTVFEAESLEDKPSNRRPLLEEQRIPRGLILARDGTTLARNRVLGRGSARRFVRTYPEGSLVSHAVGYSFIDRGRAGLERSRNDELTGEESEFESVIDELTGDERVGNDVRTTLDPKGQRTAIQALGGRRGSVVALEPDTGRVRVMVSVPAFDPNDVPDRFAELNRDRGSPLLNRATQARYQPGSAFKVVTAAAALDTGKYGPGSFVDGRSPKRIGGVPLENFGGQDFGPVTLTEALTNSVNTVFAEVGEKVGQGTVLKYMKRFGFDDEPPMDYPRDQLTPSGVFGKRGRLLEDDDPIDVGRVAIGQERLQVTPLQMAMVAATVGNKGRLMKPRLTERIVGRDGRVKRRVRPSEESDVMKPETAAKLAQMMSKVVEEGSGTAAALEGIQVAGKTGTAEVLGGEANQPWFIAFAPLNDPEMAIAVTLERRPSNETGGEAAAPIAKRVLQVLIGNG
jgi:peptidoglycan glycosyltransferase